MFKMKSKKVFTKRWVLVGLLLAVLVIAGGCSTKAKVDSNDSEKAGKVYELKSADVVAVNSPYTVSMNEVFIPMVKENTDGKYNITHFPAGQLGNDQAVIEGLKIGTIDFATSGYTGAKASDILTAPFLFESPEHVMEVLNGETGKIIMEHISDEMGVKIIGAGYFPTRYITSNKEILSVEDMKGLKIRVPSIPIMVSSFQAMGASPTPIDFTELFTALQSHTVEAQENPYQLILDNSFYEVQDYCSETGHMYTLRFLMASQELWDIFTDEEQMAIENAWRATSDEIFNIYIEKDQNYKKQLIEKGMKFTQPDIESFKEATKDVYKDFLYEPWVKEVYDAIKQSGQKYR